MPETVMIEADELDGIAAQLEAASQKVRALISWAINSPAHVGQQWKRFVQHGIEGRMAGVHEWRDRFRDDVDLRIKYLEQISVLADFGYHALHAELPGVEQLTKAREELLRFRRDICARWNTLEDLEDLVVAHYPITEAELIAIAKRNPAPAAWYEEDSKPF